MNYWKTQSALIFFVALMSISFTHERDTKTSIARTFKVEYGSEGFDEAKAIIKLKSGGYLVAGRTQSISGDMNLHLLKIDDNGALLWEQKIGDTETDEAACLVESADGNYIVVGTSDSYGSSPDIKDFWAIKVSSSGQLIWNKTYGGELSIDEAKGVVAAHDEGYILVGDTFEFADDGSATPSKLLLVKINEKGEEIWKKSIGDAKVNQQASAIVKSADGYVVVGSIEAANKKWDAWVIALDKEGNKKWEMNYGGGDNEGGNDILATKDGGYILVGYTYTFALSSHDFWVVKINANGKEEWNKVFGGVSTDEAFSVIETKDGNYAVCGYTEVWQSDKNGENISTEGHNILLVKFGPKGDKIWEKSIGGEADQRAADMVEADDKGLVMVGFTTANAKSGTNTLIVKVDENGGAPQ